MTVSYTTEGTKHIASVSTLSFRLSRKTFSLYKSSFNGTTSSEQIPIPLFSHGDRVISLFISITALKRWNRQLWRTPCGEFGWSIALSTKWVSLAAQQKCTIERCFQIGKEIMGLWKVSLCSKILHTPIQHHLTTRSLLFTVCWCILQYIQPTSWGIF